MAFASFCVLLVSLLLVGISVLFYINVNAIIGGVENKNEMIVYLLESADAARTEEIGETLRGMSNVDSVTFYSKEEALDSLEQDMDEDADLFAALGGDNPLPDSYRVRIRDISLMNETAAAVTALSGVEYVKSPDDFVEMLTEIRRVVTVVASAVIIALLIVSMVIISNTTRASVFARRREISIMQSVGATNSFIRFPFFVEGMINGFMAGVFATFLTWFSYDSLVNLLSGYDYLSTFGLSSIISYDRIAIPVTLSYLVAGALIGAIGSVMSTRAHLKYHAANM